MNMSNFRQTFKNPRFKYGSYATVVLIVVLAVLILVNLLADQLPLKWDLSRNQIYTLSKDTYSILDKLKEPVTLYVLYSAGKENTDITDILKRYHDHTGKIQLKFIDPNKNPGFLTQYAKDIKTISEGSIIVSSGKKYKIIASSDLATYDSSNPYQPPQAVSLVLEQRVTGAIIYVSSANNPVLYTLQGHNEAPLPAEVTKQLENQNYTIKELSLFTNPIPKDCGILMLVSPKQDLTTNETDKIRQFLTNNGRAIFLMDLIGTDFPNFQSLFTSFGVSLQKALVIETDSSLYTSNNPIYLLPKLFDHQITESIKSDKIPVLIPMAQGIKILSIKKSTTTIEPLMATSNKAWGKTNLNDTYWIKKTGDLSGPFNLAVAITDKSPDQDRDARIVVIGNSIFLSPNFVSQLPGNLNLLTNSINWLQNRKDNLSITPKSLLIRHLNFTGLQFNLFAIISVIIMPLIVFAAGLTVWLRRRHL